MKKIFFCILCILLISGCANEELRGYIVADKATMDSIAEEYIGLVKNAKEDDGKTAKFSSEQISRRESLIQSWKLRIENTESSLKESPK
jgi:hypothetical protein